jgi:hypothetical protein
MCGQANVAQPCSNQSLDAVPANIANYKRRDFMKAHRPATRGHPIFWRFYIMMVYGEWANANDYIQ